jgi:DNA replicative helicase MCM subunit Mcm2 (Cdc46/Mcm family)
MRQLNPSGNLPMFLLEVKVETKFVDIDKLVSIKGLIIRASNVIPDLKQGKMP